MKQEKSVGAERQCEASLNGTVTSHTHSYPAVRRGDTWFYCDVIFALLVYARALRETSQPNPFRDVTSLCPCVNCFIYFLKFA